MVLRRLLTIGVAAAAAIALTLPGAASAAHVQCGDTITQNTTLDSDLDCSGEDGITIGAPGITLDLAGHSISTFGTAIRNVGHDDVRIKNGSVIADTRGIVLDGVSGNVIRDLSLEGLVVGIELDGSDGNRIVSNLLLGVAISLGSGSDDNVIRGNNVRAFEGFIAISQSSRNRVVDNLISNHHETGIALSSADHTLVRGNDITASIGGGVGLYQSHDNRILDNDVHGEPNGQNPIEVFGVRLTDSHRNLMLRNGFDDVTIGAHVISGWANELRDNDAVLGPGDGFLVEAAAVGTTLLGNLAFGMDDDGFDVRAPSSRLGDNDAFYNDGYGINAVPGVTDLGGNQAYRNGKTPDCLNVVCQ
jgi:parallel beta-helix repeat protein